MSKADASMFDDKATITDEQLGTIAVEIEKLEHQEKLVAKLEEQLKEYKANQRELAEKIIPDLMLGLGLEAVSLANGAKVAISKFYSASIKEDDKESAFAWLKKQGDDAIIKSKVDCSFGKGEKERKQESELIDALERIGAPYKQKRGVHASTLKAYVREKMESGQTLPAVFNVFVGNKVKVKR